jgi:hypothetical protein
MNRCNVVLLNCNGGKHRLNSSKCVNLTTQAGNCVIAKKRFHFTFVQMLIIVLPQILLVVGLAGLLVLMIIACIKFTKGPINTDALKKQLRSLQLKFGTAALINPELERKEMEILQNKIKTSSEQLTISRDKDLQELFASNCKYIQSVMIDVNLLNRSSWIKFKELMFSFDDFYFRA